MLPIYLDYAAATPMHPDVLKAMQPYFADDFVNPSAVYRRGILAHQKLDEARSSVAQIIGARSNDIVFTAGATESINLAINGVMAKFPDANIVTSNIEHEAVNEVAAKYNHKQAKVDEKGTLKLKDLLAAIDDQTVLVSIIYANNEIGTIQHLSSIADEIEKIKAKRKEDGNDLPIYLHSDGSQAAAYLHLAVSRLGVDLLTLNGGKIYGPKQSGCLYIGKDVGLEPLISGGGQERGLRSGTESLANAVGFAKALSLAQQSRKDEVERIAKLRDKIQSELLVGLEGSYVNGHSKHRLPNNLSLTIPGIDGERVLMELDEKGLEIATGSACSASSDEPSHVLLSIGLSEPDASATLRFSLGQLTTESEIDEAVKIVIDTLTKN